MYDDWTLFIPLFLVFRLESLPFLSTRISITKYSNAHAYMCMRNRNVCSYGHLHIYTYISRLIIEHPSEWLASLADNYTNSSHYKASELNL